MMIRKTAHPIINVLLIKVSHEYLNTTIIANEFSSKIVVKRATKPKPKSTVVMGKPKKAKPLYAQVVTIVSVLTL